FDLHLGTGVTRLDCLGNGRYAVLAAHAFHLKFDHRGCLCVRDGNQAGPAQRRAVTTASAADFVQARALAKSPYMSEHFKSIPSLRGKVYVLLGVLSRDIS